MKINYLRNCNSIEEYNWVNKKNPEYFEVFETIIIKKIRVNLKFYNSLCFETRKAESLFEKYKQLSYIDSNNIAYAIEIKYLDNSCIVILNGHSYARYISF